ncbi:MAG: 30S ribosomal protein S8 [Desulfobulbaceae bacterium]|nr:30S ribosomal protein S8 [Desulfobulbaceae bacterium]
MSVSDPIADMLLRIRNAQMAGREMVEMPSSRIKSEIIRILKREGFISDYSIEGGDKKKTLRLYLKYTADRQPVIKGIRRVSTSGLRRYATTRDLPRVLGGMGVAIISTPTGIITDKEARKKHVGGEILCTVW